MLSTLLVAILSLNFFPFVLCSVCVHFVDVSHPSPLRGARAGIRCRCLCSLLPYNHSALSARTITCNAHPNKTFSNPLWYWFYRSVEVRWDPNGLISLSRCFVSSSFFSFSLSTLHCCTVGRWGNRFIMPILHSAVHLFLFFLSWVSSSFYSFNLFIADLWWNDEFPWIG